MGYPRQRLRLFERQDGLCYYCGVEMTMELVEGQPRSYRSCTRDHVVPIAKGGSNKMTNLVGACSACNGARRTMDVVTFSGIARRHGHKGIVSLFFDPPDHRLAFHPAMSRMEREIRAKVLSLRAA